MRSRTRRCSTGVIGRALARAAITLITMVVSPIGDSEAQSRLPAPRLGTVNPSPVTGSGSAQTLVLTGSGFVNKPAVIVTWTGQRKELSSGQVTFRAGSELAISIMTGTLADRWTVQVRNPDGQLSNVVEFRVVSPPIPAPVLTRVSPDPVTGSDSPQELVLTGSGFRDSLRVLVTWMGGQQQAELAPSQVTFRSATQVAVRLRTGLTADSWTVSIRNADGQLSTALPFRVVPPRAAAPTLLSVTPDVLSASTEAMRLRLTGTGFGNQSAVVFESSVGRPTGQLVEFRSTSELQVTVGLPTATASWSVRVINQDGQSTETRTIRVEPRRTPAPVLRDVSPNPVIGSEGMQTLTLNGSGFVDKPTVSVSSSRGQSDLSASHVVFRNAGQLEVQLRTLLAADTWRVQVRNPDGQQSAVVSFRVDLPKAPAPVLRPIAPATLYSGGDVRPLSLTGTGFTAQSTVSLVSAEGRRVTPARVTFGSATELVAAVAFPAASDVWAVRIQNPDGQWSNIETVRVIAQAAPAPRITSVSPATLTGSRTPQSLTITGEGFVNKPAVSMGWTGGMDTLSTGAVTFRSSTELSVAFTTGERPDTWTVQLRNPDDQVSNVATFRVQAPGATRLTLTAVSPGEVVGTDTEQTFRLVGTGFSSQSRVMATYGRNTGAARLVRSRFVDSTRLDAFITTETTPDTWEVWVEQPGEQRTDSQRFRVTTATEQGLTVLAVTPNPVAGSDARQTLTLRGSGFVAQSAVTVAWTGGSPRRLEPQHVIYRSATELAFSVVTQTTPDTWSVWVTNPDGRSSNRAAFAVESPTARTMIPTGLTPGTEAAQGTMVQSTAVQLMWAPVTGATHYALDLRDLVGGTRVVDTSVTGATVHDVSLQANRRYRWSVAACSSQGCSSYAPVRYFNTPAVSNAPTVSAIRDQTAAAGSAVIAVPFTLTDPDTPIALLRLAVSASNTSLLPAGTLQITAPGGDSGTARLLTLTPAVGQTGTSQVTVTATDGITSGGTSFRVVVPARRSDPVIDTAQPRTVEPEVATWVTVKGRNFAPDFRAIADGRTLTGQERAFVSVFEVRVLVTPTGMRSLHHSSRAVALDIVNGDGGTARTAIAVAGLATAGFSVDVLRNPDKADLGGDFGPPAAPVIDAERLRRYAREVSKQVGGVAADGASTVVLKVNPPADATGIRFRLRRTTGDDGSVTADASTWGGLAEARVFSSGGVRQALAWYRAPADYADLNSRERRVIIEVIATRGAEELSRVDRAVMVSRPPVLLVHGFDSSPATWTNQGLKVQSQFESRVYEVNYAGTNKRRLSTNTPLIGKEISRFKSVYLEKEDRVAARVDYIGHSMGGVLARAYATSEDYLKREREGRGDLHRVISMNSPHQGSDIWLHEQFRLVPSLLSGIAEGLSKIGPSINAYGAAADLALGSCALERLREAPVRGHALVSRGLSLENRGISAMCERARLDSETSAPFFVNTDNVLFPRSSPVTLTALSTPAIACSTFRYQDFLFLTDEHDDWVSVRSQTGGMPSSAVTVRSGEEYRHTNATSAWTDDLTRLLNTPASSAAFGPFPAGGGRPCLPDTLSDARDPAPLFEGLVLEMDSPAVAMPGQVVRLRVRQTEGTRLDRLVVMTVGLPPVTVTAGTDSELVIPQTAVGTFRFRAVGLGGDQLRFSNEVALEVLAPVSLQELLFQREHVRIGAAGESVDVAVAGRFSDGIWRDLTLRELVTFSSTDPAVASVDEQGRIVAVAPGSTTIRALAESESASVRVTVAAPDALLPVESDAGPDEFVETGAEVQLAGTARNVPAGEVMQVRWTQISGPPAVLTGADTPTVRFTADVPGVYVLAFAVNTLTSLSEADLVSVTVASAAGPVVTQAPGSVVADRGDSVALRVTASAVPAPQFQWFRNDMPLEGMNSATLSLDNLQIADSGFYRVRVSNPLGSVLSDPAVVIVTAPPDGQPDEYRVAFNGILHVPSPGVLANDSANADGTLSVQLARTVPAGDLTLAPDGGFVFTPPPDFSGTTTFMYRPITASGEGRLTTVRITVDPLPTELRAPRNLRVVSVSGNLVEFRWDPPLNSVAPTQYELRGGNWAGPVTAYAGTGSTDTAALLAVPDGSFFVEVRAETASAISEPSNTIRLQVNAAGPPTVPQRLSGHATGSDLTLSWTNPVGDGPVEGIRLDVTGSVTASFELPPGERFHYSGAPAGTYSFSVRSRNLNGISAPSTPVTLSIPGMCSPPLTPTAFSVSDRAHTPGLHQGARISASWEAAAGGPAVLRYEVRVTGDVFVGSVPTTERFIASAVTRGTYSLSVVAVNQCGESAPTAPVTVVVPW